MIRLLLWKQTMPTNSNPGRLHPRIQAVDTESGLLTPFFFKWLIGLWERSGGYEDAVASLETVSFVNVTNTITENEELLVTSQIQAQAIPFQQDFTSRSVNTNYTASPYELVSMTNNGNISLPPYPNDNDKVKLFNKNGSQITLNGNGNTISGESSIMTVRKYTVLDVQYFSEIGEWVIT